jgi:hypothetical protein
MAARFKRYVGSRPTRLRSGGDKRMDLGMRFTGTHVPALAHYLTVSHDHATNARIGIGGVQAAFRKPQCVRHMAHVIRRMAIFVQACFP